MTIADEQTPSNARTVVVADPDETARRRVVEVLRELAARCALTVAIHEVERGDDADAKIREVRPDLVVAEILLEGHSGLTLLRRHADATPTAAWVFVTELTAPVDRQWALRCGAHGYLAKPCDTQTLAERLAKPLERGGASAREKLV